MIGCFPKVLNASFDTNIDVYMHFIYVINVIYEEYDMFGALTYTICMYVNMGFIRNIRTSGTQPNILYNLQNCV